MKGRKWTERKHTENRLDDESFLRGIYQKAVVLDYERRENERVLANRRRLRRQWLVRLGVITASVIGLIFIMRVSSFDRVVVLPLSSALIALGLLLEHVEQRLAAVKESGIRQ